MLVFDDGGRATFTAEDVAVGLVWGKAGLRRLVLGRSEESTRAVLNAFADAPWQARPRGPLAGVIRRIKSHLKGRNEGFLDVPVDLESVSEFSRRVLEELRRVPPGEIITYGELAARAGKPGAARAVGRVMGSNPVPLVIPCHRCLGQDGSLTGFSTEGGIGLKARMLQREGYVADARYEAGLRHLRRVDPVLRKIIHRAGPYRPLPDKPEPPWDTLVSAIIHQQLSVKAGRTIAGRVRALTPGARFPRPEEMLRVPTEDLRAVGLSTQKTSYVQDLAARVHDGTLGLRGLRKLDDEAVIAELTRVRGIGRWSAQMHLIFHLDRLDVLPTADLGLKVGAGRFYGLADKATPLQLEKIAAPWAPYRSLGSWYLWRGLDAGGL